MRGSPHDSPFIDHNIGVKSNMTKAGEVLHAIDTFFHRILLVIAQIALAAMIIIVCTTVYYRYVLNAGIIWAEEVPRILVALFAFIACAMGVRDQLHVGIGVLYNRFPKGGKARKVMDMINYGSTMLAGAIMLYYGWNLCIQLAPFTMPATEWPRWVQYISMPICGAIMIFDSLLYILGILNEDDRMYSEKEEELEVIHLDEQKGGAH